MNVESLIDTLSHCLQEAEVRLIIEESGEQYLTDIVLDESSCGKYLYIKQIPRANK